VFIGDGELKESIFAKAQEMAIDQHILFLGVRKDVPQLLKIMNLFLFPSLFEGLGMAVIEAQAAGLPVLMSDTVPPEVDVVPLLVQRLSLAESPATWARCCYDMHQKKQVIKNCEAEQIVSCSDYNIGNNIKQLEQIYSCLGVGQVVKAVQ